MISAACLAAALDRDRRLSHPTFRLYVVLHAHLDTGEPRPIKRLVLANQLGMRKPNINRALGRLLAMGYIQRGPDAGDPGRRVGTYRLTVSPLPKRR